MGILNHNAMMQTAPDDTGYWSYGGLPQASQAQGSAAMIQPPPQPAAPPQQDPRQQAGMLGAISSQLQPQAMQAPIQGAQGPSMLAGGGRPEPMPQRPTQARGSPSGIHSQLAALRASTMRPEPFMGAGPVAGPGTGREDKINARLSDGEYVWDAESVSLLGDGSNDAGAKRLDELRERLRAHKGKGMANGDFSPNAKAPEAYLRGGL